MDTMGSCKNSSKRDATAATAMKACKHCGEVHGARVYLAASYARKEEMRGYRDDLKAAGYSVTSRWIDRNGVEGGSDVTDGMLQCDPDSCYQFGLDDARDICRSDFFVMFTGDGKSSGGRHTELGIAIASSNIKAIIIVGPRENVFQCMPSFYNYKDWNAFCKAMWDGIKIVEAERVIMEKFLKLINND